MGRFTYELQEMRSMDPREAQLRAGLAARFRDAKGNLSNADFYRKLKKSEIDVGDFKVAAVEKWMKGLAKPSTRNHGVIVAIEQAFPERSKGLRESWEALEDYLRAKAKVRSEATLRDITTEIPDYRERPTAEKLVGLIIPDALNPFFSSIAFAFEEALRDLGLLLIVATSGGVPKREDALVQEFREVGVRGLIYVAAGRGSNVALSLVASGDIPFLVVDRPLEADPWPLEAGPCDFLGFDSRRGTQAAVDYLVAHGHHRIGYLKGLASTETARERYEAFRGAMSRLSRHVPEDSVFEGDYRVESGHMCASLLIEMSQRDDTPTAMLCANDLMAIGLMQKLQEHGWELPRDLSVVGFDNISWSEWVYPSLTTIAQPVKEIVRLGADLLARRLAEFERDPLDKSPPVYHPFTPVLIERKSVAVPVDRSKVTKRRWGIRVRQGEGEEN